MRAAYFLALLSAEAEAEPDAMAEPEAGMDLALAFGIDADLAPAAIGLAGAPSIDLPFTCRPA